MPVVGAVHCISFGTFWAGLGRSEVDQRRHGHSRWRQRGHKHHL